MHNKNLLNRTINGIVFMCSECKDIQIEFNNLVLVLNKSDYNKVVNFILNIDLEEWQINIKENTTRHKIILPIKHNFTIISINYNELLEMKLLLGKQNNYYKNIRVQNFNFKHFYN